MALSDFFASAPFVGQGASQGLLQGTLGQLQLQEAAKDRAIQQQLADQSNPVRLAAAHALEALTTYVSDPTHLGELKAAGLLPHAQALSQALGQTASDGDFSHVNLVPGHQQVMGMVQGSPGAVQVGQQGGSQTADPGPISSFYAPGNIPDGLRGVGGNAAPLSPGASVVTTPYGGSNPPAGSTAPNNGGGGSAVTAGPYAGGAPGGGGLSSLGDVHDPVKLSYVDANGSPLTLQPGQPIPAGAKLLAEVTVSPGPSAGPLLSAPARIRFPVTLPAGVDARTLSWDQLTPLIRQGFSDFATPEMRQHGWNLAMDPNSNGFHYSLAGPEQKTGIQTPAAGGGNDVVPAASHPDAKVTPPPFGAGPEGGVAPVGGSPPGVGAGVGGGESAAPPVAPLRLPPDLTRAGIPSPPGVSNAPDPLAGAIQQLASTSTGILQGLAGVDPGNVQNIINRAIEAVVGVPGDPRYPPQPQVADAWRIYQQAAAPGSLYLPTQVLQMATNFQTVLGNAWQIAFNAQMAPYEKRASILSTAANATDALGKNVGPIETGMAALIKAPSEAYQAGGLGAQAYTAADVALKTAEETARHNATQDQIDQVKPVLARLDQRWSERGMAASSLGTSLGIQVNSGVPGVFTLGGGFNSSLTQSQRNMAAQMSVKQMMSDVLALRELGLRGNAYAGAVADGYLKTLTAEYNANPASVDVIPPSEDTLTGLDYIHSTAAQRASVWAQAGKLPGGQHQINQITALAKAWEGQGNPRYQGPRYQDVINHPGGTSPPTQPPQPPQPTQPPPAGGLIPPQQPTPAELRLGDMLGGGKPRPPAEQGKFTGPFGATGGPLGRAMTWLDQLLYGNLPSAPGK